MDYLESNLSTINKRDLIEEVFVGKIRTKIICSCSALATRNEPFYDLMLQPNACMEKETSENKQLNSGIKKTDNTNQNNANEKKKDTLSKLLENFFKIQDIEDFCCGICNQKNPAKKIDEVWEAPSHLILTINSFEFIKASFTRKKVLHETQLEDEIKIHEHKTGENKIYKLYGAVIHRGVSPNSGHYYSIIRNPEERDFYIYDDLSLIHI